MLQTATKTRVAKTVTMFFTVAECPGKSLKRIFMKSKWLNVVTELNGFTECVNESQILFRKTKFKMRLVVSSVLIKKS